MSSSEKVAPTVAVRDVREGDVVRMVAPDGEMTAYDVHRAGPPHTEGLSDKEYVRLTVHPRGFNRHFTESRLLGADRELELIERATKGGQGG